MTSLAPSQRRWRVAALTLVVMAAFYLLTRHAAHTFGVLPYLLILACPLMHLFGHRHRDHGHHDDPAKRTTERGHESPE